MDRSRVTIDRILIVLGDRGWIIHSDGRYEQTPRGEFVASELRRLLVNAAQEGEEASNRLDGTTQGTATDISLGGIGFLARSQQRIEVLNAVRTEPRTRDDFQTLTDTSPATLSRILADLEDRDWIDRTNHRCRPPPRGMGTAATFTQLLSNLAAAGALDELPGWPPTGEFEFELTWLEDAQVSLAIYWEAPTRSIRQVAELVRSADYTRLVGPGGAREVAESIRTLIDKCNGTFEGVVEARGVETIRDDDVLREHFQGIPGSDRATIPYLDENRLLLLEAIVDDTVVLCGSEDRVMAHHTTTSDHERVNAWVKSHFEAAKANPRPRDIDAIRCEQLFTE